MRHLLLYTALFLPVFLSAQDTDCCCCGFWQKGQIELKAGRYQNAINKWELGKKCPDQAKCGDLTNLIKKARNRQADDDVWNSLKDSNDPQSHQKYLDKYPMGMHAEEARNRIYKSTPGGFVFVPGGTFEMGDTFDEGNTDEKPVHMTTVSGFYMSIKEVSFADYDAFCDATGHVKPSDNGWGRGGQPVINVDWYDAVEYCNWKSQKDNLSPVYVIDKSVKDAANQSLYDDKRWKVAMNWNANGYRLPTEAEWEYAARATFSPQSQIAIPGGRVRFGNGQDIANPAKMNYDASGGKKGEYYSTTQSRMKTVSVGSLGSPNPLGLYDMAGNVWEWCNDWYGADYYATSGTGLSEAKNATFRPDEGVKKPGKARRYNESDVTAKSPGISNPHGPDSGSGRCLRGGSWNNFRYNCRASDRFFKLPADLENNIGFRVVRH